MESGENIRGKISEIGGSQVRKRPRRGEREQITPKDPRFPCPTRVSRLKVPILLDKLCFTSFNSQSTWYLCVFSPENEKFRFGVRPRGLPTSPLPNLSLSGHVQYLTSVVQTAKFQGCQVRVPRGSGRARLGVPGRGHGSGSCSPLIPSVGLPTAAAAKFTCSGRDGRCGRLAL